MDIVHLAGIVLGIASGAKAFDLASDRTYNVWTPLIVAAVVGLLVYGTVTVAGPPILKAQFCRGVIGDVSSLCRP